MRHAIGRSVHIGLDAVSGFRYGVRARPLMRAKTDTAELAQIASAGGFSALTLRDGEATKRNVLDAIACGAAELHSGDTFALTFSGHGLAAVTSAGFQQSWCLFDDVMVRYGDRGLDAALAQFREGVRVMVIANCCFAATGIGPTPDTPAVRAYVVRIASCMSGQVALDTSDDGGPSPFVASFKAALRANGAPGFFDVYERLRARRHPAMLPHIEIGDPRSESFLAAGPFKLP